jgi:hypothetical protein
MQNTAAPRDLKSFFPRFFATWPSAQRHNDDTSNVTPRKALARHATEVDNLSSPAQGGGTAANLARRPQVIHRLSTAHPRVVHKEHKM